MARDRVAELEFRDFVTMCSAALQRTAYLLVGDWALAEDLIQTALMKIYLVWRRLEVATVEPYARKVPDGSFSDWSTSPGSSGKQNSPLFSTAQRWPPAATPRGPAFGWTGPRCS